MAQILGEHRLTNARPRQPDETDQIVGNKVREVRKSRGLTMKQLASHLGVSYQQVQKYEIGSNRIPVSRLATIAQLLGVSVGMFYDQVPGQHFAEQDQQGFSILSTDEERLLAAFSAISSPEARKSLLAVADQMAQSSKEMDATNKSLQI